MDLAQLGPHLTPILTVAILVSAIKPFLEVRLPRTAPLHDATIRLLAIGLGLGGMLANYLLHTAHAGGPGVESALGDGLLVGVGAILTYHLVAGDLFAAPVRS
jgi:hypothetical protein